MTSSTGRFDDPSQPHSTTRAPGDDGPDSDLGGALDQLARLTIGSQSLESSLEWIATLASSAIAGADGAGIAMLESGRSETVCVSATFVRAVDDVQYGIGEGPCITAAAEAQPVVTGDLGHDPRWPRFAPRVRDLGVNSALSLPMVMADGEVMGAINVYARERDAFVPDSVAQGTAFAATAAVVVNNARELMQARRLIEQLRTALSSRATIDQAIGILMSRQGGSPEDAFAALKRMSQNRNIKLAIVATEVVTDAVVRARARHGGG